MEFRHYLASNGVSPAGAEEALTGQPVANPGDQTIIRKLGYYVAPGGEVILAKSLGPRSALPAAWLALERKRAAPTNYLDQAAAQRGTLTTARAGRTETAGLRSLPGTAPRTMDLGKQALTGLMGRIQIDAGQPSAADRRKARIEKLKLQIAALKAAIESAKRKLEAELLKEAAIWHLANPITFPFFVVVYDAWKERVRALQMMMMDLIVELTELYAELARLEAS